MDDPAAKTVFWLSGMAVTGKSTISRTVADSLLEKGYLGATFFFKRGEADRANLSKFMPTIASQLSQREPSLAVAIRDAIESDSTVLTSGPQQQFKELVLKPLSKMNRSKPMVIIVDALDECETDEEMRLLINLFLRVQPLPDSRIRVFITTRPETPIRLEFSRATGEYRNLALHEIPAPVVDHDILLYLRNQLEKIRSEYNEALEAEERLPLDWPGEDRVTVLLNIATPLFISAVTACRFITTSIALGISTPNELLQDFLEGQGRSTGSQLADIYLPVLDLQLKSVPDENKAQVVQLFRYIVGTIVILANPLSVKTLAKLLDVTELAIKARLNLLHSVLEIPSSVDSPVRLLHLSFGDFLVTRKNGHETLWVDENQSHQLVAENCIRIMSAELKADICDLQAPGTERSSIRQQKIHQYISPELQYSCLHWVYHLSKSDRRVPDEPQTHIFLNKHLLHWLEGLSLIGRASESLILIEALQQCLAVSNDSETSRRGILTNPELVSTKSTTF